MLGILGGMGPLTSAEFLKTIYELNLTGQKEQRSPQVILYSDPTFPDRTEHFLNGDHSLLLELVMNALYKLVDLNVSKIVMCCITSHYLVPYLPPELKVRLISLIDIALAEIISRNSTSLLLCTEGTRRLGIFEASRLWQTTKQQVFLLNETDQSSIHDLIYRIKTNLYSPQSAIYFLKELKQKYQVDHLIAGCTEFHLLSKYSAVQGKSSSNLFLDPLTLIAEKLAHNKVINTPEYDLTH